MLAFFPELLPQHKRPGQPHGSVGILLAKRLLILLLWG
jgi:hypothetical protein